MTLDEARSIARSIDETRATVVAAGLASEMARLPLLRWAN
jgi:hypothetical protein